MKRAGDMPTIASMFRRHSAKMNASSSPSRAADAVKERTEVVVMEEQIEESMQEGVIETNDDHFRREVYLGIVDQIIQELDNRFDEINMELLSCMSALSPANSFAAFDAHKVRKLAEFYPDDFKPQDLIYLELQLENYIDDMRKDENFQGLENLVDLSVKLVETRRHIVYDLVYLLLKLVLLLPVATANVERAFSSMTFVKNKLRNKMGDGLLDDCLVTYIERDTFSKVDEEDIIETFMAMTRRKPHKKK